MSGPRWSYKLHVALHPIDQTDVDGSFVLYYAATAAADTAAHCVGAAISTNIRGPYTPIEATIACPISQGGAIDPAGHHHPDGSLYVVYKVDGNSIGHGGSCNNGVAPIVLTPIMLQEVAANGYTLIGAAVQILDRSAADGPLGEVPSLIYVDGVFFCSLAPGATRMRRTCRLHHCSSRPNTGSLRRGVRDRCQGWSKIVFHAYLGATISSGRGF
ncbi:glycosyl hydrolase [Mycena maculata]|uniref:Glycosyl hydrolase n=1 Tax=Mycena maculata TaxID=230809 RepID=A0AAD7HWV1_9AGAR|nr:glycosyl hydrolase [Mycena maculata]